MKSYRKALAALVLVMAFSSSAFAEDGIIWPDRTTPPPPATSSATNTDDSASTTEATDGIMMGGIADTITEAGLSLLGNALTLI